MYHMYDEMLVSQCEPRCMYIRYIICIIHKFAFYHLGIQVYSTGTVLKWKGLSTALARSLTSIPGTNSFVRLFSSSSLDTGYRCAKIGEL